MTTHTPTKAQRRLLRALETTSLDAGRIELSQLCGFSGAALERCIESCQRKGFADERGITNFGVLALLATRAVPGRGRT